MKILSKKFLLQIKSKILTLLKNIKILIKDVLLQNKK